MTVCPTCRGLGEVPVPRTHGPTISPEHLETRPCPRCHGEEVVTPSRPPAATRLACGWHFTDLPWTNREGEDT